MPTALVWFRNDLRLADNPALRRALDEGYAPVCVYIHAPGEEGDWAPGAASDAWRRRSLDALDASLQSRGSRLRRFVGPSLQTLKTLALAFDAEAVFWNRRYEPAVEQRDTVVKRMLRAQGLRAESANAALLYEPWDVANRKDGPYRVFGAFWRTAGSRWNPPVPWDAPAVIPGVDDGPAGVSADALKLGATAHWDAGFWQQWRPGEAGAAEALEVFTDGALRGYATDRDRPDRIGTSRLSPHLHFGEISPWRVVAAIEEERNAANAADADAFVRELGWREFAHHLLHHFPESAERNLNPRFAHFDWARADPRLLDAWRRGRTGVPIVDAGMRELWATGWMHNRVRMVAASYLTKHMRIHWREGARWFWDTLVDADLANNTMGWQWVAGTGADAAPYFRIFNPVTQARRFDPDGEYIARWVPELAHLPAPARWAPWTGRAGSASVRGYPARPVVDLASGREAALTAYGKLR